jgi:hypothetical protein
MLRRLVQRQRLEISRLQTQLNFVLTFLGIDEGDISIPNEAGHSDRFVSLLNPSHSPQDAPAASTGVLNELPSWTEIVRRKQTSKIEATQPSAIGCRSGLCGPVTEEKTGNEPHSLRSRTLARQDRFRIVLKPVLERTSYST